MKKFEIKVVERKKKETNETFLSYQALTKTGRWMDLRFTKEVKEETRPTHSCMILVDDKKLSVDRTRKFPVVWVSEIAGVEEFDKVQDVSEYFD